MNETTLQKQHILEQLEQLNPQGISKLAQLLSQVASDRRYRQRE